MDEDEIIEVDFIRQLTDALEASERNRTAHPAPIIEIGEAVEGTWAWALEQMKADKAVDYGPGAIRLASNGLFLWEPSGIEYSVGLEDFERTDWRIAE